MTKRSKAKEPKRLSITLQPLAQDHVADIRARRPELRKVSDVVAWALRIAAEKGNGE